MFPQGPKTYLILFLIWEMSNVISLLFYRTVYIWNQCLAFQEGLRTLCVAYRRLSQCEYEEACHHLTEAKLALQDREQKLAQAYDIIERDFVLLGATAVEDRSVRVECERKEKI